MMLGLLDARVRDTRCRSDFGVVASAAMQVVADIREGGSPSDRDFMEEALAMARQGALGGEVPVGALVVRDQTVIARAHNAPIALVDPTGHAEILALRRAAQYERNYRLPGTTLYVTVEPCLMCVGAAIHARVERVVFGCREPKAGALGSLYDLGCDQRTNHYFGVTGGICAEEARALLRGFFLERRRGA